VFNVSKGCFKFRPKTVKSSLWLLKCAQRMFHLDVNMLHDIVGLYNYYYISHWLPSVLWHCWLGGRKGIRPVKTECGVLAWLSVWSKVQMICLWSSRCHCHCIISCYNKIQNGLSFWCQLTQVFLEKRPLNGCSSSVVILGVAEAKCLLVMAICVSVPGRIPTLLHGPGCKLGEW